MSPTLQDNVLNWATVIEDNTLEQARRTASLPFVSGHVALMPDAHLGFGSTVGSVIPTQGAIIPAAIGVDIGCGMIAVETRLHVGDLPGEPTASEEAAEAVRPLLGRIREVVPAGAGQGRSEAAYVGLDHFPAGKPSIACDWQRVGQQFGTLGGGNHFIEVCLDERNVVWVVLHSGSRGIGKQIADVHIAKAKADMKAYFIELPDPELAYLVEGTDAFGAYIADMLWAQSYALGNREAMMDAVLTALRDFLDYREGPALLDKAPLEVSRINSHHNFTELESHHGRNMWITRKGAVRARVDDQGIIPGSMGTGTYIVHGTGNPASYHSCAHGAGRRMSRSQARRTLDIEGFKASMEGKTWNDRDAEALLDEDPRSYKDVIQVMQDQKDLVEIDHTLHQILNYKGIDRMNRRRRRS